MKKFHIKFSSYEIFFFFYLTACHRTSPVVRGSKTHFNIMFYIGTILLLESGTEKIDTIEKIGKINGGALL